MVISIKRIILILLSVLVGVFTALNFAYPLKIRLGLAVVLTFIKCDLVVVCVGSLAIYFYKSS